MLLGRFGVAVAVMAALVAALLRLVLAIGISVFCNKTGAALALRE